MNKLSSRTPLIALILLSSSLACSLFAGGSSRPERGQPAPDFELNSSQGEAYRLSGFQGHPVLLNFWATWCGPCVAEMPQIQRLFDAYQDDGLVVLAVSSEDLDKISRFGADHGLSFPLLVDGQGQVSDLYHISGYPTSFFIDPQGKIQDVVVGSLNRREFEARLLSLFDEPPPTATTSSIPHDDRLPALPASPTPGATHTPAPTEPGFVLLQGCLTSAEAYLHAAPDPESPTRGASLSQGDCLWFDGRDLAGVWLHALSGQASPDLFGWVQASSVALQGNLPDLKAIP